jgi:hypothetical protein
MDLTNKKLKRHSDLPELEKKGITGYIVLDAYMDGYKEEYRHDIVERLNSMGNFNLQSEREVKIYTEELFPIYRTYEEAFEFVDFAYGNTDKTYVIKKVTINIHPEILDINAERGDDKI